MNESRNIVICIAAVVLCLLFTGPLVAQNSPQAGTNPVQATQSLYYLTAQTATAAVNNQTTLTIAAPGAGLYIYVCSLKLIVAQDNTSTANTSQVTTSTNFGTFALKYSLEATANKTLIIEAVPPGTPASGCVKSAAANTATTFVSPSAIAQTSFTWVSTWYAAP